MNILVLYDHKGKLSIFTIESAVSCWLVIYCFYHVEVESFSSLFNCFNHESVLNLATDPKVSQGGVSLLVGRANVWRYVGMEGEGTVVAGGYWWLGWILP